MPNDATRDFLPRWLIYIRLVSPSINLTLRVLYIRIYSVKRIFFSFCTMSQDPVSPVAANPVNLVKDIVKDTGKQLTQTVADAGKKAVGDTLNAGSAAVQNAVPKVDVAQELNRIATQASAQGPAPSTGPDQSGQNAALLGQAFTTSAKDPYSTVAASVGNVALASQGTQMELAKGAVNIATDTAKDARNFAGEAARASTSDTAAHSTKNIGDVAAQAVSAPSRAVGSLLTAPIRGITYGVKSLIGEIRSTHDTRILSERRTELIRKRNEVADRAISAKADERKELHDSLNEIDSALNDVDSRIAKLGSSGACCGEESTAEGGDAPCCGGNDVTQYIVGGNENAKHLLCLDVAMMILVIVFLVGLISVCKSGDCSWNKKLMYCSGGLIIAVGAARVIISYFA